ncbi:MAG: hypothetical protein LKH33_07150 [Acetobacter sp.]|jgi:hypothetical protein|nr:hypothetical protein [Acetobacter sp.]MCH4062608.1 hypothetical protein [Acetobacter sp.]MCH4088546.1 hypothetical protein [Acetobacter sp.]MCI1294013.1 hypothetical protein [Acetobacter sp.]MCI1320596.1 hypothetical protein [Acetobacter sp.]
MSYGKSGFVLVGALLLAGCNTATPFTLVAEQQSDPGSASMEALTSLDGRAVTLKTLVLLEPDCSSAGTARVTVVKQPQHGQLAITPGAYFPAYPETDPHRYACNVRKYPGVQVRYTPDPGYMGVDRLTLLMVSPKGKAVENDFRIDMKPSTPAS